MLELSLLKCMKRKKDYKSLINLITNGSLDPVCDTLLQDYKRYFETFDTHEDIDIDLFTLRFKDWHSSWEEDKLLAHLSIIRKISEDIDDATRLSLKNDILEFNLGTQLNSIIKQYEGGFLNTPLIQEVQQQVELYKKKTDTHLLKWESTDIEELLREDLDNSGLKWRLDCINNSMRPLRPGDFGIIAARPDKGKTTFLASEITYMAPQLPEDKNVIWLNNEGSSTRVWKRVFQAALGKTNSEMLELLGTNSLKSEYINAVGRLDKIRIFEIQDFSVPQIEEILEQSNPGLIIYDMLDNIKFCGTAEQRTDSKLESLYQWARDKSVKYHCVSLATSQISADGEGEMFPTLGMLKDSKTGKQGACDFQLMIGASLAPELEASRYISLPKNKLHKENARKDPRAEVYFDIFHARYIGI